MQVMAASGGKAPYVADELDFIAAKGEGPNYLLVTAVGDTLTVAAYDGDGQRFDAYTILR